MPYASVRFTAESFNLQLQSLEGQFRGVGWLADWLIDLLVGWLVGRLVG
jgi:hypothetical protein